MEQTIKTKLRVGDTVVKISGKDKGKTGEILSIDKESARVLVKGLNLRKKWQKSQENPQGTEIEMEMPMHISNVMYYDSKSKKGSRLGYKFTEDKKGTKKVRVVKKSDKEA